jgi:KUP system potassium uptake protein
VRSSSIIRHTVNNLFFCAFPRVVATAGGVARYRRYCHRQPSCHQWRVLTRPPSFAAGLSPTVWSFAIPRRQLKAKFTRLRSTVLFSSPSSSSSSASARPLPLAIAYGVAVTGTITITTILSLLSRVHAGTHPNTSSQSAALSSLVLISPFSRRIFQKLLTGGWFPVGIALAVFVIFKTWDKGRAIVSVARIAKEGPLREFIESVHEMSPPLHRVPGTAVFLNANAETTPLALRANTEHNHTLHESIIILTVKVLTVPSVPETERVSEDDLGYGDDGIFHLCVSYGFNDRTDVPAAIALACEQGLVERELDLVDASYFVSRIVLRQGGRNFHHMARWRKMLFLGLAHYAADPVEYFSLPVDRTVVMGGQITV